MDPELERRIRHFAGFPAKGVSLSDMVQFGHYPNDGVLFRASQFVCEELPIRLAHRIQELASLPHSLGTMPSIWRVSDWYVQSFAELTAVRAPQLSEEVKGWLYYSTKRQKFAISVRPEYGIKQEDPTQEGGVVGAGAGRSYYVPISDSYQQWPVEVQDYNQSVTKALQKIKARHDGVVATVAQGVVEWKKSPFYVSDEHNVQEFLDKFYMSRIGIRMLIGQQIALNLDRGLRSDYVGIICTDTNVKEEAQIAVDNARFICEDWYGLFEAPKVILHSNAEYINFMYVPGHLSHIVFELVKNSLRAVVESYGVECESFPPVKVVIAQGEEDITIKISDEGGGIPRRHMDQVWTYMYTSAEDTPTLEHDANHSDFRAPLAGFGYGLPISRLYARYFGGDLRIISMEGYGTDAYLHLNRLLSGPEPV